MKYIKQNSAKILFGVFVAFGTTASANVTATFYEGAPKDRFSIINNGDCTFENLDLILDLSGSNAGLIFDVTSAGAGVEVFQPLDIYAGQNILKSVPNIKDGDHKIEFQLDVFKPNDRIEFTIDVDDTVQERGITVSGSEIVGAKFALYRFDEKYVAEFSETGIAQMQTAVCG